jgi:hypothetical protein
MLNKSLALAFMFLLLGFVIYILSGSQVAVLNWLELKNNIQFLTSPFIRNHLPDLCFAACTFFVANYFVKNEYPKLLIIIAVFMPGITECLQAIQLIKGRFDFIDLAIYLIFISLFYLIPIFKVFYQNEKTI